jgi:hypothetical protein
MNSPRRSGVAATPSAGSHQAGQIARSKAMIDPIGASSHNAANLSAPVFVNPITACHAGAVNHAVFHRSVERDTQFLLAYELSAVLVNG